MSGRYLTPVSMQLACVQAFFDVARTAVTCSQAVLAMQTQLWQQNRRRTP